MPTIPHKVQGQLAYPYGRVSSDEEALTEILNAWHHHSGVPQERLRVEVRNGHAVLSGVVSNGYERELAEQVAERALGVAKIENEIKIES